MKRVMLLALAMLMLLSLSALAEEEVVSIPSPGGWEIPATVSMPEGEGPFPFVVMFHGTGSTRDEAGDGYKMLAPKLAEAGIASIRFDFVGFGDSTGDSKDYTYTSGMNDGIACIEYMQSLPQIAGERVGVLGWSQGGSVAMLTAGRYLDGAGIKSMVTWAGAVDMSFYEADKYDEAAENGYAVWEFDWRDPVETSLAWYDEVRSIDLAEELKNYKGAALAIAGTEDDVVPLSDLDTITGACPGEKVEKWLLEGADHTYCVFTGDLSIYDQLAEKTVQWYADTL